MPERLEPFTTLTVGPLTGYGLLTLDGPYLWIEHHTLANGGLLGRCGLLDINERWWLVTTTRRRIFSLATLRPAQRTRLAIHFGLPTNADPAREFPPHTFWDSPAFRDLCRWAATHPTHAARWTTLTPALPELAARIHASHAAVLQDSA